MLKYFDILFVRTYKQYVKWNEKDFPGLYGLMLVSLFQTLNIMFLIIITYGFSKGRDWSINKIEITLLSLFLLAINSIRVYKLIGIKKLLSRYENDSRLPVHPVLYFILSIAVLVILRIAGIFPHIV